jgi:hypothetical protein
LQHDRFAQWLRCLHVGCLRKLGSNSFFTGYINTLVSKQAEAWLHGVSSALLEPVGIRNGQLYSWSEEVVDDIVKRNEGVGLKKSDFLLPRKKNGPFFVSGWTAVGPQQGLLDKPYRAGNRSYHFFEATPLYVGTMRNYDSKFHVQGGVEVRYGGVIEPYAFPVRGGKAPKAGLPKGKTSGELEVPVPAAGLDLVNVAGTSSLYPAGYFESFYILDVLFDKAYDYWSPTLENPNVTSITFSDGGYVQNIPLIPFLQRGVEKIVIVAISSVKFDYSLIQGANWRETKRIPSGCIDWSLPSFFGVYPDNSDKLNDPTMLHVFETEEFGDLLDGFHAADLLGKGIFYRKKFTTVENLEFGIEAGRKVDVTFYFNGVCHVWKDSLPADVAAKVLDVHPATVACGMFRNKIAPSEYENFPHYHVTDFSYSFGESNLLANLTGWAVKQHEELLKDVFS